MDIYNLENDMAHDAAVFQPRLLLLHSICLLHDHLLYLKDFGSLFTNIIMISRFVVRTFVC